MKQITEIKQLYSGQQKTYPCRLIQLDNGFGIVQHILEQDYKLDKLTLNRGMASLGFFWEKRPYNVYQWYHKKSLIGSYFNISDQTRLTVEQFSWRDLYLDILIYPDYTYKVLDRHEVAQIKEKDLLSYIQKAEHNILTDYPRIIDEINVIINRYQLN